MRRYRPGKCNIGMLNRISRLFSGLFSFSAGVWGWAFLTVNSFPEWTKLLLFILFYLGFVGMYQAVSGFCLLHGLRKSFDMR